MRLFSFLVELGLSIVIAGHRVGAKRCPMVNSSEAIQFFAAVWIASSQGLLAMTEYSQ
jgi:hypothetical protein